MKFILIEGSTDEKIQQLEQLEINNDLFKLGASELKEVVKNIRFFGVPDDNFEIDFSIARGLDYYTGTVYETFLEEYEQLGSVCSGGRYENLAENYTDKKLPGVGVSIGLTRLFDQLNDLNLLSSNKKSIAQVLVVPMLDDKSLSLQVASKLRNAGINTQIYFDDKKIKAKFKYADRLQIPFVIIIGEDEVASNTVTLKNMQTGEQETLTIEDAISKIIERRNEN
jgi:histidyl-tRNA synthetase